MQENLVIVESPAKAKTIEKFLGKDYVDVENDDFLKAKTAELDELIATKPKGADARRLEQLRTLKERLEQRVAATVTATATPAHPLPARRRRNDQFEIEAAGLRERVFDASPILGHQRGQPVVQSETRVIVDRQRP